MRAVTRVASLERRVGRAPCPRCGRDGSPRVLVNDEPEPRQTACAACGMAQRVMRVLTGVPRSPADTATP